MHDLKPLTPMGNKAPKTDWIGVLILSEVTDTALASVTCRMGQETAFAGAATTLFGQAMPAPGTWAAGAPYNLIWTSPGQWFAEAPYATHSTIAETVKSGLGATASVTEQTDGWARFDIKGDTVVDLLERLCPVPARTMQTGTATRTLLEHMGCFVICRKTSQHFTLLAPRSLAASLHHALCAAARSVS